MLRASLLWFVCTLLVHGAEPLRGAVRQADSIVPEGLRAVLAVHGKEILNPEDVISQCAIAADGSFALPPSDGGSHYQVVIFDAANRVIWGRSHCKPSSDLGTITIPAHRNRIQGTIRDPAGQPLTGIPVFIERKHDNDCSHYTRDQQATSDATGSCTWTDVATGTWRAVIVHPDWVSSDTEITVTPDGAITPSISAIPAARIEGTVRDSDGKPLPGATIKLKNDRQTTTDANGAFRFDGLEAGKASLDASLPDMALPIGKQGDVNLLAGKTATCELTLVKAGSIALTIRGVDPAQPLPARIDVSLNPKGDGETITRKATLEAGMATIKDLGPGTYDVSVDALGFSKTSDQIDVVSGETASLTLTLPSAHTIRGKIVTASGAPPEAPRVDATITRREKNSSWSTTADDVVVQPDGTFTVSELESGDLQLDVSAKGHIPQRVKLSTSNQTEPLTVTLIAGTGRTIQACDGDGKPIPEAEVTISLTDGPDIVQETGADGIARFDALPDGELEAKITHDHFVDAREIVVGGVKEPFAVSMQAGATISGVVLDPDGKPLANAHIFGWCRVDEGESSSRNATSDIQGRFTMHGLIEGTYQLNVHHDLGNVSREVAAGSTDIRLQLPLTIPVQLQVIGLDGKPKAGLDLSMQGNDEWESTETDANGHANILLTPGRWVVNADETGGLPIQQSVIVTRESAQNPIEIRITAGITYSGTVTGPSLPADLQVHLMPIDGRQRKRHEPVKIPADGAFSFSGIAPGRWMATVSIGGPNASTLAQYPLLLNQDQTGSELPLPALGTIVGEAPAGTNATVVQFLALHGAANCRFTVENRRFSGAIPVGRYRATLLNGRNALLTGVATVTTEGPGQITWDPPRQSISISGRIESTSERATRINLFALPAGPVPPSEIASLRRDRQFEVEADGSFKVTGLSEGPWLLVSQHFDEGNNLVGRSATLVNAPSSDIEIRLHGHPLTGQVLDSDGQPVAEARVGAIAETDEAGLAQYLVRQHQCDEQGRFSLEHFSDGARIIVVAEHDRLGSVTTTVEHTAEPIVLRLAPRRNVTLTGLPADAAPFAVAFQGQRMIAARYDSGSLGFFGSEGLGQGPWTIHVWARGYAVATHQITITEDVQLPCPLIQGGNLLVRLQTPEGSNPKGRILTVVTDQGDLIDRPIWTSRLPQVGDSLLPVTDVDGTSLIKGLAPGRYRIECSGGGTDVDIVAGKTVETTIVTER